MKLEDITRNEISQSGRAHAIGLPFNEAPSMIKFRDRKWGGESVDDQHSVGEDGKLWRGWWRWLHNTVDCA
jgi:hypothetical protein